MVLFGRKKEIARVLALIRSPRESALAVTGGHGSGKSSLLAEIPNLHDYKTVLLRANPSEWTWPFSGLTALLNGIDDPALAPLTDYVATSPRENLDAADLSTMLLSALRQWSADRTVVVVDDAEQLDPASQMILGFVARRLAGTGLVLIVSMRGEAPDSPFARMATLHLENLSHPAAKHDADGLCHSVLARGGHAVGIVHARRRCGGLRDVRRGSVVGRRGQDRPGGLPGNELQRPETDVGGSLRHGGMGAAVLSNVPDGETWVGVPAHETDREPYGFGSEQ